MPERGLAVEFSRRGGLFLDRDGVVNFDRGFVHHPDAVEFIPGIFDLGRTAMRLNLPIMIITNQSGVARGLYSQRMFADLMTWMTARFQSEGIAIAHVEHCPWYSHDDADDRWRRDSWWRKPSPGMLSRAAMKTNISVADSVMIGDRPGDVEAGKRAGVAKTVLFSYDEPSGPDHGADHRCSTHAGVIDILNRFASQ